MEFLLDGIRAVTPQQCVMYVVGALLIYLAIKKDYEPSLLLPMGFGAILVNLPMSGVLNQMVAGVGESQGIIQWLFETTIEASEALPLLLFIGIRRDDRLRPAALEPEDVPLRRGGAVRHFLCNDRRSVLRALT